MDNKNLLKPGYIEFLHHADETTYNKIHRHLTDINDIISEEDIRNVKIFAVAEMDNNGGVKIAPSEFLLH